MISTFPNQNEILGIPHIKKQPKQGGFLECECISDVNCLKMSAPSIHASLPKNTIFLYPETLSCLDHERVGASDLLKREEVEMGQLVPGEVEVVAHPSVPVVPHCSPVLSAPLPAGPCVAHLANILPWLSQALTCSVGAYLIIVIFGTPTYFIGLKEVRQKSA